MSGESLRASGRKIHIAAVSVLAVLAAAGGGRADAQTRLKAHYTLSMTGVPIGQIAWLVTIGEQRYTTSANGKASGVLSVLVNGEGSVDVRGMIVEGYATPRFFTSKSIDDEGNSELRMTFEDGSVKELSGTAPLTGVDRVPVTDADRHGVSDPLSAMLVPTNGEPLQPANCNHVLAIFDGRRRYDLTLSYKRVDKVALERSFSGVALVCGVMLKPIAGHRADSMLVKYVAGRRDMELWFAPVSGTPVMAPIRVVMPTLIGTLEIAADQFDVQPSAPASVPPH
jgi:CBS domain-containing protein